MDELKNNEQGKPRRLVIDAADGDKIKKPNRRQIYKLARKSEKETSANGDTVNQTPHETPKNPFSPLQTDSTNTEQSNNTDNAENTVNSATNAAAINTPVPNAKTPSKLNMDGSVLSGLKFSRDKTVDSAASNPKNQRNTQKPPRQSVTAPPTNSNSGTQPAAPVPAQAPQSGETSLAPRLKRYEERAGKANAKLEKARDKLPHKKKIKITRQFNEEKGTATRRLVFEKEVKKPPRMSFGTPQSVNHAVTGVTHYAHGKIHQVEKENSGVEGAHKTEKAVERSARTVKNAGKRLYEHKKNAPFKKVERLEKKAHRANTKALYEKSLADNPQLRKSNPLNKMLQKRAIKRRYAEAYRNSKNGAEAVKNTSTAAYKLSKGIGKTAKRVLKVIAAKGKVIALWIIGILLAIFFVSSMLVSCTSMVTGIFGGITEGAYEADITDISAVSEYYTELEADLQEEIMNVQADNPGYDEYRFFLNGVLSTQESLMDAIRHNPFELMAYLAAVYQDFSFGDISADLLSLFNEQYTLTLVPEVEVRTRMVSVPDGNGGYTMVEEEYDYNILNVRLEIKPLYDIIIERLTDPEQLALFELLMDTQGGLQIFNSPFDEPWHGNVSSPFGWRIHPVYGDRRFHNGIDISKPAGTPVHTIHAGTVLVAQYSSSYGNYVIVADSHGFQSVYAHFQSLNVVAGQKVNDGDIVGFVGTTGTSTGNHLHLEILFNGTHLDPMFFLAHFF